MNSSWDAEASSSNTSSKPPVFIDGVNSNSISLERDNGSYNCAVVSGSPEELSMAINTESNWVSDNSPGNPPLPMICNFECITAPIPTLSQWGIIALGMLTMILGVVTLKYSTRFRLQVK